MKYKSVKEFINDMIDNPGVVFADDYGRKWRYRSFEFMHKDIGDQDWHRGLFCLHLYGTNINKKG